MTAPVPVTLGYAVTEYLKTLRTESTKRTYGRALDRLAERIGERTQLEDVTPGQVAAAFTALWGSTSDGTIATRMNAVRGAARWWAKEPRQWTAEDLSRLLERPSKPRETLPLEHLTPEEVQRLLAACSPRTAAGIRSRALIMLLYRSGLRISEALAIRTGDLDFAAHSVRLRQTKSGSAQTRFWHPSADDALLRWTEKRRSLGIRSHTLFCGVGADAGKPILYDSFRNTLDLLAARAGITKRVHAHGLRGTFATELEAQGVPLSTISKLLGHSSVAVTARYLQRLTNAEAGKALESADLPDVTGKSAPRDQLGDLLKRLEELERKADG